MSVRPSRHVLWRPTRRWPLVAALTLGAAMTALTVTARAEEAAARWGTTRPVAVLRADVPVGRPLTADDVERVDRPVALLPADTLDVVDVLGRSLRAPGVPGDVVHPARLAPAGRTGTAAALDRDQRAVAVPVDAAPPPVEPGARADLFAPRPDGTAERVAANATVVEVAPTHVVVAVAEDEAPAVAAAVATGQVVVARAG